MEPHFSLKRIFVSTTLIAVGLALLVRVLHISGLYHWIVDFPICFVGGIMLGAGAMVPFKQTTLGALIGLILSALYLGVLLLKW